MAERNRPHLFIEGRVTTENYRRPPRKMEPKPLRVPENRASHGETLQAELEAASSQGAARRAAQEIRVEGSTPGIYVTFESFPGIELAFESLDPRLGRVHPQLRLVRSVVIDGEVIEQATVFIPDGKLGYFLKRIQQYQETATTEKPRHRDLLDRIRTIGLASLERLWTDPPSEFPATDDPAWWEVWLRRDGHEVERLRSFAEQRQLQLGPRVLAFTDRSVALVRAAPTDLAGALDVLDDLAELRRPRAAAEFIALQPAADQTPWVEDLADRLHPPSPNSPAACIVDTGVDQGHVLLAPALEVGDCHACDPAWNTDDHHGHGTEMAGLALFGDLGAVVGSNGPVHLRHRLESVKFLPPVGANPPELYGAVTATATSLVEIQAAGRRRVFAVATTSDGDFPEDTPSIQRGQPSAWSAAVDALAAGLDIETTPDGMVFLDPGDRVDTRLFVVSAGNINEFSDDYLTRCDLEPVQDPAQAWNGITVGAHTELINFDPGEPGYDGWSPLAPVGELSPYSRTSVACDPLWPVKPDIVMEGGNVARSPAGDDFDWPIAFQRLTTKRRHPDLRPLTVTRQTSAATAQAAHLAASIMAELPNIWPETVRALIVHAAEWTAPMRAQLDAAQQRRPRDALHRRYGMGVPDLTRATRSANDALTLVVEDIIHPFDGEGRMREIHFHSLPWPTEVLSDLGGAPVRLRVTLSYFIEPNPGSRGWVRRYSYASHGLRFDVRRATESNDAFRKRLNQLALAEEERRPTPAASDSHEWYFGPDYRVSGSLHSDIWTGTAADLADRGAIAVYPVTGWWKELKSRDRSDRGARYALVVSIETPDQDVDIWTPVAQQIGVPVEVTI
ncbi:MAG: S8 family peptidase [Acidimicrobiales bacterium]